MNFFLVYFEATLLMAFVGTLAIRRIAIRFKVLDYPNSDRKLHAAATPLLGGAGIFLAFWIMMWFGRSYALSGNLEPHHWVGVFIGGLLLMLGGLIDDIKKLPPLAQFIFPLLAALSVVLGGVGIEKITALSGGLLYLNAWKIPLLSWGGNTFYFSVIADSFTILWLLGMTYTTKLLDGVDGLVTSITATGSLVIFLFTTTTRWHQPDIAFVAFLLLAACLGFLIMNWHPAKIFLGEGGSLFLGFMLGVLSIISGGKIAIALLIMGIPILDVAWTILRRLLKGKNPFRFADRQHLHFRLQDAGLGPRLTVSLFCLSSLIFGLCGLFLQGRGKLLGLLVLAALMIALLGFFAWLDRRRVIR